MEKRTARERKRKQDQARAAAVAHDAPVLEEHASPEVVREVSELARRTGVTRYSRKEVSLQLQFVEHALMEGWSSSDIARAARGQFPEFTEKRATILAQRIKAKLAADAELRDVAMERELQRRRLNVMRTRAWGKQVKGEYPNMDLHAAGRIEKLHMDLCGTAAKKEVDVNVTGDFTVAMMKVIGGMLPEEADALLEVAREEERLAGIARAMLPSSMIDAPAIESGE